MNGNVILQQPLGRRRRTMAIAHPLQFDYDKGDSILAGLAFEALRREVKAKAEKIPFGHFDAHFVLGTSRQSSCAEVRQIYENRRRTLEEMTGRRDKNHQKIIAASTLLASAHQFLMPEKIRVMYELIYRINPEAMYGFYLMNEKNMAPTDFFDLYELLGLKGCARYCTVLYTSWNELLSKTKDFYSLLSGFSPRELGSPSRRLLSVRQKIDYLRRVASSTRPGHAINETSSRCIRSFITTHEAYYYTSENPAIAARMVELKGVLLAFEILTHKDSKRWYDNFWKMSNRGFQVDDREDKVASYKDFIRLKRIIGNPYEYLGIEHNATDLEIEFAFNCKVEQIKNDIAELDRNGFQRMHVDGIANHLEVLYYTILAYDVVTLPENRAKIRLQYNMPSLDGDASLHSGEISKDQYRIHFGIGIPYVHDYTCKEVSAITHRKMRDIPTYSAVEFNVTLADLGPPLDQTLPTVQLSREFKNLFLTNGNGRPRDEYYPERILPPVLISNPPFTVLAETSYSTADIMAANLNSSDLASLASVSTSFADWLKVAKRKRKIADELEASKDPRRSAANLGRALVGNRPVHKPTLEVFANGSVRFDEYGVTAFDYSALGRIMPNGTRRRLLFEREFSLITLFLTKAMYMTLRRFFFEMNREHTNWNNCPAPSPLKVDVLLVHMNVPMHNTFIPIPSSEHMDVFTNFPFLYNVFRPKKVVWSELLDLSAPSTDKGFLMHLTNPSRYLRLGWTEQYDYDIDIEMPTVRKDLLWRIQLYYDKIVRLFTIAKRFCVDTITLQFQRVLFHNIPELESSCFELLSAEWAQMPPHALVSGLINAFLHQRDISHFGKVQLVLNDHQTGWLVRMLDLDLRFGFANRGNDFYIGKEFRLCKSFEDFAVVRTYELECGANKLTIEFKPELSTGIQQPKRMENKFTKVLVSVSS